MRAVGRVRHPLTGKVASAATMQEVERRRHQTVSARSAFSRLRDVARRAQAKPTITWPSTRYQKDPVGFFREVLGIEPWSKQVELLEAAEGHERVAATSGHKCGKSTALAGLGLWHFHSFPDSRVCITATTSRQVDGIIYREIKRLHRNALVPLDGEVRELARSGIKAKDGREIVGFTAKEPEAVAGISGANLLYLVDEASGIADEIFEAIEGNRAGGGRVVMISNPTRNEGRFFDAFHGKADFYRTVSISSEETPNATGKGTPIRGLAGRNWIDEMKSEYGEDSAFYAVRVRGQFATHEEGKVCSLHLITEAESRWEDTPAEGPLRIGVDPAGDSDASDETLFAARRGKKQIAIVPHRGLDAHRIVEELLVVLRDLRRPREKPAVIVDSEGLGFKVYQLLSEHLDKNPEDFHLVRVRASERATREPTRYDRVRDELWANGRDWLRDGGALMADPKQSREIHAPSWHDHVGGTRKVTPKLELRKALGRSTDRADAWLLSCWEPMVLLPENDAPTAAAKPYDPYAEEDLDDRVGEISPYGGGLR